MTLQGQERPYWHWSNGLLPDQQGQIEAQVRLQISYYFIGVVICHMVYRQSKGEVHPVYTTTLPWLAAVKWK